MQQHYQILIVSVVKICKQYVQTASASGVFFPRTLTRTSTLDSTGCPRPLGYSPQDENCWPHHSIGPILIMCWHGINDIINSSGVYVRKRLRCDGELVSGAGSVTFPSRGGSTFSALRPTKFPAGKKLATMNHLPSRD